MKNEKTWKMFIVLLLMIVLSAVTVIVQGGLEKLQHDRQESIYYPEKRDLYNNYGLPNGESLSDKKLAEDDRWVIYSDRIFLINQINNNQIPYAAEIAGKLRNRIPQAENIFVMPVPERAVIEKGYEKEKESYINFADELQNTLPEGIHLLNPLSELESHQDEFIYFRTENQWTTRGAFYASQMIFRELGYEEENLDEYREYLFGMFSGNLKAEANAKYTDREMESCLDGITRDPLHLYIKGTNVNREELTLKNSQGETQTVKRRTIQFNSTGSETIIGSIFEHSVVEGMGEGSLLLISDYSGKMMISYLSELFEKIYVVNIDYDGDFAQNIERIVSEYDISQVLWAQDAAKMGDPSYMYALNFI